MRVAICDDEIEALDRSRKIIEAWAEENGDCYVECFTNGDSLISAHLKKPFDLIFLDIIMPLLNGLEAAAEIRERDRSVKIVFLTASSEFAVESYSVRADNYLLKPASEKELRSCLEKTETELSEGGCRFVVKAVNGYFGIDLRDIEYVEAENKYNEIFLSDGESIRSLDPLYTYESKLKQVDGFFKCHRSYIVNVHRIKSFTSKEITMQSGKKIPISRGLQKAFEAAYFSITFGE